MSARTTASGLLAAALLTAVSPLPAAGGASREATSVTVASAEVDPSTDLTFPFGHSARGSFLLGRSGEHLLSPTGATIHRKPGASAADGMWRICGDTLVTATSALDYADRVSWRDLGTGRTGTTDTERVSNYLGPAPGGILYVRQTPTASMTHSDIVLRRYDGSRAVLATIAGMGGGGACDTSGIAAITRVDATSTAPAKQVLSFVRFSGGAVTLATRTATEGGAGPISVVEVNGTSVLWSTWSSDGPTTLYRTDVGGATTTVVTVPASQSLVGAGASASETLYSIDAGATGTVTTSLRKDGTRVAIDGGPQRSTSWRPVGSSWRGAGGDGLWTVTGTTATRIWTPPHVIAGLGRQGGPDRYGTSTVLHHGRVGIGVVYVASGATPADALSGTPAAASAGGPLVLTAPTSLPATVRGFLEEKDPAEVVVLGGTGSVSAGVEQALRSYAPTVRRVAGPDRYATAAAVSRDRFPAGLGGTVVVASGGSWPDALAAGPVAAHWNGPLLLTAADRVPAPTVAELDRLAPERIVIVGGTGVVSAAVEAALRARAATVQRVAGSDRYRTAAALTRAAFPEGSPAAYIVSGEDFPDGLAAGTAAAHSGGVVLPAARTRAPDAITTELTRLRPAVATIVGGEGVLSWDVYRDVERVWWP